MYIHIFFSRQIGFCRIVVARDETFLCEIHLYVSHDTFVYVYADTPKSMYIHTCMVNYKYVHKCVLSHIGLWY